MNFQVLKTGSYLGSILLLKLVGSIKEANLRRLLKMNNTLQARKV